MSSVLVPVPATGTGRARPLSTGRYGVRRISLFASENPDVGFRTGTLTPSVRIMFERHGSLSGQRLSPPPEDDLRERFIPPGGNAHSMGVVNRRLSRTVSHCPHLSQPRPDASSLPSVGGGGRKGPVGRYGIRISGMAFPTAFVIRWMACCTRRVLRTPAGYGRPCRKSVCGPSVNGPRRDRRSVWAVFISRRLSGRISSSQRSSS